MSLRFPRPQNLLGALPYQPFKRVLRPTLLRTQNASHLEQTQLTCNQARRFKSTTTHAGNIVQDPKTGGLPTAAGIEVRPCWPRLNDPLTPAVASQIGDSPERGTENTPCGLETSVWGKLREFLATERPLNGHPDELIPDGPHVDHSVECHFRLGDPKNCSVCANPLFLMAKKSLIRHLQMVRSPLNPPQAFCTMPRHFLRA
jgi:hypothetical protein